MLKYVQSSIIGPLLFQHSLDDLIQILWFKCHLYANNLQLSALPELQTYVPHCLFNTSTLMSYRYIKPFMAKTKTPDLSIPLFNLVHFIWWQPHLFHLLSPRTLQSSLTLFISHIELIRKSCWMYLQNISKI